MKKSIYLFLMSMIICSFSSCGSDEEEVGPDGAPITFLFNDEDQVQVVHEGDEIVIQALRNAKMRSIATGRDNLTILHEYSEDADPQVVRYIYMEEPVPTELTFHWLNIKQEAPDKFTFTVKDVKEDSPKVILMLFFPEQSSYYDANRLIEFKLE